MKNEIKLNKGGPLAIKGELMYKEGLSRVMMVESKYKEMKCESKYKEWLPPVMKGELKYKEGLLPGNEG